MNLTIEERMAKLAARIADPDEKEREYASKWLEIHWSLYEAGYYNPGFWRQFFG